MIFGLRSTPFVPAKAGTQTLALDSRLRGNERSLLFTPFVPAKAGTQFFLDSRLRGNERSTSKAARDQNRGRFFHTSAKPVNLTASNA